MTFSERDRGHLDLVTDSADLVADRPNDELKLMKRQRRAARSVDGPLIGTH
jgi:hypothetical protein